MQEGVSATTIITVIGMVLTSFGALGAALFAYLAARDKLKFSAETVTMKQEIKNLKSKVDDCELGHTDVKGRLDEVVRKAEVAEKIAAKFEGELAGADRERKSLQEEVNELRDRLHGRSGKGRAKP